MFEQSLEFVLNYRHVDGPDKGKPFFVAIGDNVLYNYFYKAPIGEWLYVPHMHYHILRSTDLLEHVQRFLPSLAKELVREEQVEGIGMCFHVGTRRFLMDRSYGFIRPDRTIYFCRFGTFIDTPCPPECMDCWMERVFRKERAKQ